MDTQAIIDCTRRWIAGMVIELDLCPFARRVFQGDKIRYLVSPAENEETLLDDLTAELITLTKTPLALIETTLLIHPRALANFLDYNDFLDDAEQKVKDLGLRGVVQIAGFHPDYQFAGTEPGAVENYTNRSPYPMLHLLREESITTVAGDPDELRDIPRRNIETLKGLGIEKVLERLRKVANDL
jgi:hypothetical protein